MKNFLKLVEEVRRNGFGIVPPDDATSERNATREELEEFYRRAERAHIFIFSDILGSLSLAVALTVREMERKELLEAKEKLAVAREALDGIEWAEKTDDGWYKISPRIHGEMAAAIEKLGAK